MQAHTGRLFGGLSGVFSNNRCVSDQLGALGRRRIHVHVGYRRQFAGVDHALLEQLTFFFSNASIVLEDADTHRSNFRRRVKAQTIARKRWHGARSRTGPETKNAGTQGRHVAGLTTPGSHTFPWTHVASPGFRCFIDRQCTLCRTLCPTFSATACGRLPH